LHPIFIDTEFSGLTQDAALLSLALVPADGPWFYAVFNDADTAVLSPWHQKNIVPHLLLTDEQLIALPPGDYILGSRAQVLPHLLAYLATFEGIVVWADVPAYDWVLFCDLFGGALQLPKNIHYIVRDLATLLEAKGYDVDTDRFALAYGGENAGAKALSSDGRVGEGQALAATAEGLLRHNALGDALACRACWEKLQTSER
jgi:hypothetical protein